MKLLIAIQDNKGDSSRLSEHFGHCPYFAIIETQTKKMRIVRNDIDHANEKLTPVDHIMKHNPDMVVSLGMGQRAIRLFHKKAVKLRTGKFTTVKEVVEHINELKVLDMGCAH